MKMDKNILLHYFTGESSESEKDLIRRWLESDEVNRKQFIRERIRFDASIMVDEDEVFAKLHKPKNISTKKRILFDVLKAASVILLLILSSFFYNNYSISKLNRTVQNIYVPPGNRTSVTLPDGTVAWLNSNTTLTYPGFFLKERVVKLNGEGYFEVAKDEGKPFIIHAGKFVLEVLGTSFDIEAYDSNDNFEIALFTGKVKLYKPQTVSDTVFLNAGETAKLVDEMLVVSATMYDLYKWKDGIIVLEDKSFEDIMSLFEKYYDLKINIQTEKVKKLGYRGKFRIVDGIDHALRVLQNDYRFTYKREDNSNVIYIY